MAIFSAENGSSEHQIPIPVLHARADLGAIGAQHPRVTAWRVVDVAHACHGRITQAVDVHVVSVDGGVDFRHPRVEAGVTRLSSGREGEALWCEIGLVGVAGPAVLSGM